MGSVDAITGLVYPDLRSPATVSRFLSPIGPQLVVPPHRTPLPQLNNRGQAPKVLKRWVAIIVGGWTVTSLDVDSVPNPHVIG